MELKWVIRILAAVSVSLCIVLSVIAYSDNTGSGASGGLLEFAAEYLLAPEAEEAELIVDINHCSKDELLFLPRIGNAMAQRIIDDCTANGPYTAPEDLLRVKGIGEETLEQLRPHIVIQ